MKRKRKITSVLVGMMASVGIISSINIPETSSLYKKERELGYLSYDSVIKADHGVGVGINLDSSSTPKMAIFNLALQRINDGSNVEYFVSVPNGCVATTNNSGLVIENNIIKFSDGNDLEQREVNLSCTLNKENFTISLANGSGENAVIYGSYTLDYESYNRRLQYNNFISKFRNEVGETINFDNGSDKYVKFLNFVGINSSTIVSESSWLGITKQLDNDGSNNGYYIYAFENLKGYVNTLDYLSNNSETRIYFSSKEDVSRNTLTESLKMYGFNQTDINYIMSYIDTKVTNYSELFSKTIDGVKFDENLLYIEFEVNILDIAQGNLENYFSTFEIKLSNSNKLQDLKDALSELEGKKLISESLVKLLTEDGSAINTDIINIDNIDDAKSYYVLEDKFDYLIDVTHEINSDDSDLYTTIKITLLNKSFENLKNDVETYFDSLDLDYSDDSYEFMLYFNSVENKDRLQEYIKGLFVADEKYIYKVDFSQNDSAEKFGFYPIDVTVTVEKLNVSNNALDLNIDNTPSKSADNAITSLKIFGEVAKWNKEFGRFEVNILSDKLQIASDDLEIDLPTGATLKAETLELNSDITEYEYKFTVVAENGEEKIYIVVITKIKDDTPSSGDTTGGEEELPVCSEGRTDNCKPSDETTDDTNNDGDNTCVGENCEENAGNTGTGEEDADKGQVSDAGSGSTEDGADVSTGEVDGGSDATGSQDNAGNPVVEDTNLDSAASSDLGVDSQL